MIFAFKITNTCNFFIIRAQTHMFIIIIIPIITN